MVIFLLCFLSFFSLFPSRFSTLAFLCVSTFLCLFPFHSFLLFTPLLYLCVSVSVSLSFFLCYIIFSCRPSALFAFLSNLFLLSYFFDFDLCAILLCILSFVFVFPPLSSAFFCLLFYLLYSPPQPFSLSPSTPRLSLSVIPLFSMI